MFADTAGWANYFVRTEPFHNLARDVLIHSQASLRVVTTNYVVTELASLWMSPLHTPRSLLIVIPQAIKSTPWVEIVHIDPTLDEEAWALLKERSDKEWSLVNCTSFAVMRRGNIVEALTSDRHFEQAGFVRLLK